MSKSNPKSVDSVVVSRATASLEESVKDEMKNEDKDILQLLKENNESTE